jgi:hypothetical protein
MRSSTWNRGSCEVQGQIVCLSRISQRLTSQIQECTELTSVSVVEYSYSHVSESSIAVELWAVDSGIEKCWLGGELEDPSRDPPSDSAIRVCGWGENISSGMIHNSWALDADSTKFCKAVKLSRKSPLLSARRANHQGQRRSRRAEYGGEEWQKPTVQVKLGLMRLFAIKLEYSVAFALL